MGGTAPDPSSVARRSPSTARNRGPILEVLKTVLPAHGEVLEIAGGSGEHAAFFAAALPGLTWWPTDPDPEALASISAWRDVAGLANLAPPRPLDAARPESWPDGRYDAVVNINMLHITPWPTAAGLMAGAGRVLRTGGILFLYGPFIETGVPTAPSNAAFDLDLRRRDPAWGLRRLDAVTVLAAAQGLTLDRRTAMPANNLALVYRKTTAGGSSQAASS